MPVKKDSVTKLAAKPKWIPAFFVSCPFFFLFFVLTSKDVSCPLQAFPLNNSPMSAGRREAFNGFLGAPLLKLKACACH